MKDCCDDKGKRDQLDQRTIRISYTSTSAAAKGTLGEYILDGTTHQKLTGIIKGIDEALHKQGPQAIQLIVAFLDELNKIPEGAREQIENTVIGAHSCQQHIRSAITSVKWQIDAGKLIGEIDSLLHGSNPNEAIPKILAYLDLETRVPHPNLVEAVFSARQECAGHLRQTIELVRKQALAQMQ